MTHCGWKIKQVYPTKEKLEAALVATARRPAYERTYANYWANPGSAFPARYTMEMHVKKIIRDEDGELTAPPPWMAKVPGQEKIYTIPVMKAGMTPILVTGDANRNKVQTMPGGNSATIEVKLPAKWDELMAKLGYQPLKEFFLAATGALTGRRDRAEQRPTDVSRPQARTILIHCWRRHGPAPRRWEIGSGERIP